MGQQIIKQPDGKFAVWSSIVDDFIITDATVEEIVEIEVEEFRETITKKIERITTTLNHGELPYGIFTLTYEEACSIRNRIHGKGE